MTERKFMLVDFTHMSRAGCLQLYEAGRSYTLPRAIAHAATKRQLVAGCDRRAGRGRACSGRPRC